MKEPTVFVIHSGKHPYLEHAIYHSMKHGNKTILIGDNRLLASTVDEYIDYETDLKKYTEFSSNYQHLSSNAEIFEKFCFKRFFLLEKVIQEKEIEHFWMIDSDVILTENLSEITNSILNVHQCNVALSIQNDQEINYRWSASPHTSLWTRESLSSFTEYLALAYKNDVLKLLHKKYWHHLSNGIGGGICDMTLLYLWQRDLSTVFNLASAHLNGYKLYDHRISDSGNFFENGEEFQTDLIENNLLKKIIFDDGSYYCINKLGQKIGIGSLHFQGDSKPFMQFVK